VCQSARWCKEKKKKKNFGTIAEAVVGDNLLGLVDDGRAVNLFVCVCVWAAFSKIKKGTRKWVRYANDLLGTGLCRKQAQDGRSAANVEHDLVLEQVRVVDNGVAVRVCSDLVLEHLLVDSKVRVRVKVVVGAGQVVHAGAALVGRRGGGGRGVLGWG